MKGDVCEFLHQYDKDRMPECRWGAECDMAGCPFRHLDEEDRVECVFYQQGLCIHGPYCRYRHVKRGPEDCPEKADFDLQLGAANKNAAKKNIATPNEFYKITLCKHWQQQGECPFGDNCHFAHGSEQLRSRPAQEAGAESGSTRVSRKVDQVPIINAVQLSPVPDEELPDFGMGICRVFLVRSFTFDNLAHGIRSSSWATNERHYARLNQVGSGRPNKYN